MQYGRYIFYSFMLIGFGLAILTNAPAHGDAYSAPIALASIAGAIPLGMYWARRMYDRKERRRARIWAEESARAGATSLKS